MIAFGIKSGDGVTVVSGWQQGLVSKHLGGEIHDGNEASVAFYRVVTDTHIIGRIIPRQGNASFRQAV